MKTVLAVETIACSDDCLEHEKHDFVYLWLVFLAFGESQTSSAEVRRNQYDYTMSKRREAILLAWYNMCISANINGFFASYFNFDKLKYWV